VDLREGLNLLQNYSLPPTHLKKVLYIVTKKIIERKEQVANAMAD